MFLNKTDFRFIFSLPNGSRGAPDKLEPVPHRLTGPLHDHLVTLTNTEYLVEITAKSSHTRNLF
jgi:hypothetical protein